MDRDLTAWCNKPEQKGHYFLNCYRSKVLSGIAQFRSLNLCVHLSENWATLSDEPFRLPSKCSNCPDNICYSSVLSEHPASLSQPLRKCSGWGTPTIHSSLSPASLVLRSNDLPQQHLPALPSPCHCPWEMFPHRAGSKEFLEVVRKRWDILVHGMASGRKGCHAWPQFVTSLLAWLWRVWKPFHSHQMAFHGPKLMWRIQRGKAKLMQKPQAK